MKSMLPTATISHITDRIIEHIDQWKSRRLENIYVVVWLDTVVFKVRQEGKVINKAVQIAGDSLIVVLADTSSYVQRIDTLKIIIAETNNKSM